MADKFETEEFNSTEIDIEEIKKSDKNEGDWELVSAFEADAYSVPFISVPKMHEVVEESDAILYGTSLESGMQGDFSHTMNERKDEVNKEQLPPYQHYEESEKLIDETKEDKFFPLLSGQESKEISKEIYEAMKDISGQEQDYDEEVRLAIDEAMRDDPQTVEKNNAVGTKTNEVMQDVLQEVLENERVRSEMDEAINKMIGEKANIGSSARCGKSQTRTIKGESLAEAKSESGCQVVQREFIETFQKTLEFNTVLPDKVSIETAKDDTFVKDKDLRLNITPGEMESLLNEELNDPSLEECKKM